MSITASFDLLLRGGRVICPASGVDGIRDIAIRNGKIAAVASDILPTSAREVVIHTVGRESHFMGGASWAQLNQSSGILP